MADKKELDVNENPKFLYQLTQKYMLSYVKERGTKEDKIWFAKLGLANKKEIKRGDKSFDVLDVTVVRKEFAKRFFPDLVEKKSTGTKKSYFDELQALLDEEE